MQWTTVPRPYGPDEAREFLAHIEAGWADPKGHRYWAIEEVAAPGVYLGTIDLRPRGLSAEVGFGLHPQGRGRGVMSGALRLVCRYWFSTGGQQVTWWANRGNWASWRVAWACGFTHRGTLPGYLTDEHGAVDAWVATLLAEDPMDPLTPWSEPPVIESATDGLRLRPWRDQDVDTMEDRDQPAHFMPARGILDQATFPEWLLVRRERMSWGKTLSWAIADLVPSARCCSLSTKARSTMTPPNSAIRSCPAPVDAEWPRPQRGSRWHTPLPHARPAAWDCAAWLLKRRKTMPRAMASSPRPDSPYGAARVPPTCCRMGAAMTPCTGNC